MQNVSLDIILPAAYIPGDMALLPIWITSGSCFALIHSSTNDVPLTPSCSRTSAIPSTIPAPSTSRVYLSRGLFHLVLAKVREPIESFLISDENAIATSYESSQLARGAPFLDRLYFRSFSPAQNLR